MLAHVRGQHHVDHHLPQGLLLLPEGRGYTRGIQCLARPVKIDKDITFWVLEELEGDGQVVVLQHRLVVVHQRELGAWGWQAGVNILH